MEAPSGPPGAWASRAPNRHSGEFCVQLSGQVANSSARTRVQQATPAFHRDLMPVALDCGFFLVLLSAVSLQAPSQAPIWQLRPLYLSTSEDKTM